jgi:hypothetical protein
MSHCELAQLNIAKLIEPIESPRLTDFVANLDRINALAETSRGFVWRLQTEEGDATALRPFGADYIVNLTVWKDIGSLHHYVYRTAHVEIMRRRKEWFQRMKESYMVLWWVREGDIPTIAEARLKLQALQVSGPSPEAFTFKRPFPPPSDTNAALGPFDAVCPAC